MDRMISAFFKQKFILHDISPDILKIFLSASVLVVFSFCLQGNILTDLADEGFLWYGTLRTALGDIPLHDFQSYDPGRYYWTAAWSEIFGTSLMALRMSVAVFQALGLTLGMMALRRIIHSWQTLLIAGTLLLVWMHPRHKVFEHSLTMAAVYVAVLLIEKPSFRRHFATGMFVGTAAFFGRNHGFYGFISFFLLILFIWLKNQRTDFIRRTALYGTGVLAGYSPMLIMFILIPGFFQSFIENIQFILRNSTNLSLPVPWPWTADFIHINMTETVKFVSTGIFFLMLPVFYILAGAYLIRSKIDISKQKPLMTASVFVGVPYIHHIFSRADISHLAQGIHPLLIGLLSLSFIYRNPPRSVRTDPPRSVRIDKSEPPAGFGNPAGAGMGNPPRSVRIDKSEPPAGFVNPAGAGMGNPPRSVRIDKSEPPAGFGNPAGAGMGNPPRSVR
ncbi:MAG: hypothetical protein DRI57_07765, partial [Deltaproteobacteria bacterium]